MSGVVINNIFQTLSLPRTMEVAPLAAHYWREAGFRYLARTVEQQLAAGDETSVVKNFRSLGGEPLRLLQPGCSDFLQKAELLDQWTHWARLSKKPKGASQFTLDTPLGPRPAWRSFQTDMLSRFQKDLESDVSPWLGLASPMQTGKSAMIRPIIDAIRKRFGNTVRIFVITPHQIITDQIMGDLAAGLKEPVGRFDAHVKELRPVTIASIHSFRRRLDLFPKEEPIALLFDQAGWTQTASGKTVIAHFGLGESVEGGFQPVRGRGMVVGLSGTGHGLVGYHVSARMTLWEALRNRWVRHLIGERVHPRVTTQRMKGTVEQGMVWWRATPQNAKVLAEIYEQKIFGNYSKNLIYVPTIKHGLILTDVFRKRFPEHAVRFVHSKMEESFEEAMRGWHRDGGALISVRRISVGMRGTGTHSVFLTYQGESLELFAERVGRGWGMDETRSLDPLFLLEASWDLRSNFANLARLLGLVDYPRTRIDTRKGEEVLQKEGREALRREVKKGRQPRPSQEDPLFKKMPRVGRWRRYFEGVLQRYGGVEELAKRTKLRPEVVTAMALGALPLSTYWFAQDESLKFPYPSPSINPLEVELVGAWDEVVEDILSSRRRLDGGLEKDLVEWHKNRNERTTFGPKWDLDGRVYALDEILEKHFRKDDAFACSLPSRNKLKELFNQILPKYFQPTGLRNDLWRDIYFRLKGEMSELGALPPGPDKIRAILLFGQPSNRERKVDIEVLKSLLKSSVNELYDPDGRMTQAFRNVLPRWQGDASRNVKLGDIANAAREEYSNLLGVPPERRRWDLPYGRGLEGFQTALRNAPQLIQLLLEFKIYEPLEV